MSTLCLATFSIGTSCSASALLSRTWGMSSSWWDTSPWDGRFCRNSSSPSWNLKWYHGRGEGIPARTPNLGPVVYPFGWWSHSASLLQLSGATQSALCCAGFMANPTWFQSRLTRQAPERSMGNQRLLSGRVNIRFSSVLHWQHYFPLEIFHLLHRRGFHIQTTPAQTYVCQPWVTNYIISISWAYDSLPAWSVWPQRNMLYFLVPEISDWSMGFIGDSIETY